MPKHWISFCLLSMIIFSALVSTIPAQEEEELEEEEEEEIDEEKKLRIGIMKKPKRCDKVTKQGDHIFVVFNGTTLEGKFFATDKEFDFTLGDGQVIGGWEYGLLDMCVGEKRELFVPAANAYGDAGVGDMIPPKSTLVFYIELLKINEGRGKPKGTDYFLKIDTNGDGMLSTEEVARFLQDSSYPEEDGASHQDLLGEIFQHEDKDQDGLISPDEFEGPRILKEEL